MSCDANNKIACAANQVSGGIHNLSSKQAFYAGIGIGVTAAAGAGAGAYALSQRRKSSTWRSKTPVATAFPKPRSKTAKPIPALQKGGVTKTTPRQSGTSPKAAKPIPGLASRQSTRLQSTPVRVQTEGGHFQADNSYRVTRVDGSDTGLAVTPRVLQGDDGTYSQDDTAWNVTHAGSGTIISGPYKSTEQAQSLATKLAPLCWTAPQVPARDVERAKRVVEAFETERGKN